VGSNEGSSRGERKEGYHRNQSLGVKKKKEQKNKRQNRARNGAWVNAVLGGVVGGGVFWDVGLGGIFFVVGGRHVTGVWGLIGTWCGGGGGERCEGVWVQERCVQPFPQPTQHKHTRNTQPHTKTTTRGGGGGGGGWGASAVDQETGAYIICVGVRINSRALPAWEHGTCTGNTRRVAKKDLQCSNVFSRSSTSRSSLGM